MVYKSWHIEQLLHIWNIKECFILQSKTFVHDCLQIFHFLNAFDTIKIVHS